MKLKLPKLQMLQHPEECPEPYVAQPYLKPSLPMKKHLNHLSTFSHVLHIVTQEQRGVTKSLQLLPKRLRYSISKFKIKYRAKINTGMRYNINMR